MPEKVKGKTLRIGLSLSDLGLSEKSRARMLSGIAFTKYPL